MTTSTSSLPGEPGPSAPAASWDFVADPLRPSRRATREVRVGDVGVGGANPVRVQSMTIADTLDTAAVVDEIEQLHAAGSEIVRVTAPNRGAAENLGEIRRCLRARGVRVPLVADIHFTPQAALIAAPHVEKIRVNPGNYADRKHFKQWEYTDAEYAAELARLDEAFTPLVRRCKELGVAMRIGTNHGSLSDRILNRYGDTPLGMVESALEFVRICEQHGYHDLVLSMKASDVKVMVQAYRLLAARMAALGMRYPFHLGVTEAGSGFTARVKSTAGIAALLQDGIGDTVRVSLTEDSVHEIPVARALAALVAPVRAPAPAAAAGPAPGLRIDPYKFTRRAVAPVGLGPARLGLDQPPRIERVATAPRALAGAPETAGAWLWSEIDAARAGADLVLVQAGGDTVCPPPVWQAWADELGRQPRTGRVALGFEVEPAALHGAPRAAFAAASRLAVRITPDEIATLAIPAGAPPSLQYTLTAADPAQLPGAAGALARRIAAGALPMGALALDTGGSSAGVLHLWRAAVAAIGDLRMPVVLRARIEPGTPVDAMVGAQELAWIAALGGLCVDGIGDALQIEAPVAERAHELAAEILQATRLRLSKADFIACPSCGRTQFDLQTTTARIAARLGHLKGLKIAVMGCIVNGPGEMADADFGYVGSGPGKIDLYRGKDRVERGVPQSEAVDRLVELIRAQGCWEDAADAAP